MNRGFGEHLRKVGAQRGSQARGIHEGCAEPLQRAVGAAALLWGAAGRVGAGPHLRSFSFLPFLPGPGATSPSLCRSRCRISVSRTRAWLSSFCTTRALVGGAPGVGVSQGDWEPGRPAAPADRTVSVTCRRCASRPGVSRWSGSRLVGAWLRGHGTPSVL